MWGITFAFQVSVLFALLTAAENSKLPHSQNSNYIHSTQSLLSQTTVAPDGSKQQPHAN